MLLTVRRLRGKIFAYLFGIKNSLIPVEEEQLQLVDTTIFKRDWENIKYYKRLCTQELEWCQTNNEVICNKANVFTKGISPMTHLQAENIV